MADSENTSSSETWIAFMLRKKHKDDEDKFLLKKIVMNMLKRDSEDILYFTENQNSALAWYFFVRERDESDLSKIYEAAKDFFEPFDYHLKITGDECRKMFGNLDLFKKNPVGFGDIVKVERGKYRKLFGIVLRDKKNGFFEVGFKFCFGSETEVLSGTDLKTVGNLFDHIKIP